MKDYIFNIPDSTLETELSEEVQALIKSLNAIYPSFPMIGTKTVNARRIIHIRMDDNFSKTELEALFTQYNLDWIIMCIRATEPTVTIVNEVVIVNYALDYLAEKSAFLPFIQDKVSMVNDVVVTTPVTLLDDIYLPTYAGTEPLKL